MPFGVTVHHARDLLVLEATGFGTLGDLCGVFDLMRVTSERNGHRRALMDLLSVEQNLTPEEHLELGAHAADELQNMDRVASVVPIKFRVGTSEKAAQELGLKFRTFTDLAEARAWVMGN